MPQLRDSGSRGMDARKVRVPQYEGFHRIFGIETEYGVSATGARNGCTANRIATAMFRPVVSRSRSTNAYLPNGSRLYLDVGAHPEYATAEAADPRDALAQDLAGERIMRRLACGARARLRADEGEAVRIHVFKNNVDHAGHSFGCHENYLVRRFVSLEAVEHELLPFLITRQLYAGAGRLAAQGFEISQRAAYVDEAVSSATTRARPMVNTRDEPHADPDQFRRLHVIIGDSNRSQFATMMKLAVTHLVLCVIENAIREGSSSGLGVCALADPAYANRSISRDLGCRESRLELCDPEAFRMSSTAMGYDGTEGRGPLALDIQFYYLAVVEAFMDRHGEQVQAAAPHTDYRWVLDQWRALLEALRSGRPGVLADRVDWIAKYELIRALRGRDHRVARARLEQMDLGYHDVVDDAVYGSLLAHGAMMSLIDRRGIDDAMDHAPHDTRAALRGEFIRRALSEGVEFSCDWTRLVLSSPERREITLLNPFGVERTEQYEDILAMMGSPRPLDRPI